ncbi:MAG: ABC transporter permease [Candidatus Margulisbacteria bacterium]|nr:ABC transporter permease [Candidatus Margulisiibacteriota bacterium]
MINQWLDSRVAHFVRKEFRQLFRDPRMLALAVLAPVIQLIILGYVASTDIKHVRTVVFDESRSAYSRAYLTSLANTGYFDLVEYTDSDRQIARLIDSDQADVGLHLPYDFSRRILRGETAVVQADIDGSNSSFATIVQSYLAQINFANSQRYLQERMARTGLLSSAPPPLDLRLRVWYNPDLKSINFMVPSIFAQLLLIISMMLTASSIVKEKEAGTLEMLAVTPLKPLELIMGKMLPYAILSIVDIFLVFLVSSFWFGVPLRGSLGLLFLLGAVFLLSGLGLGLLVSAFSETERQASMTNNIVTAPMFMLSGFTFPIANMPWVIQLLTYLMPTRYFLEIVRNLFLKGVGMRYLWEQTWPLLILGVVLIAISVARFRKSLG